jgi:hypothetical protein
MVVVSKGSAATASHTSVHSPGVTASEPLSAGVRAHDIQLTPAPPSPASLLCCAAGRLLTHRAAGAAAAVDDVQDVADEARWLTSGGRRPAMLYLDGRHAGAGLRAAQCARAHQVTAHRQTTTTTHTAITTITTFIVPPSFFSRGVRG